MSKDFLNITCPQLRQSIVNMKKLGVAVPIAVARGMRSWGEKTRTAAIRVTPKRWGPLRNSIFVDQQTSGDKSVLVIGAGGPAAPYAVTVHEKLGEKVNWTTAGTGAKYLENPVRERMPKLDGNIASEINRELEKVAIK